MKEWVSELTLQYLQDNLKINNNDINHIEKWYSGDEVKHVKAIRQVQSHINALIANLQKEALANRQDREIRQSINKLQRDGLKIQEFIHDNEELFAQVDHTTVFDRQRTEKASSSNARRTERGRERGENSRRRENNRRSRGFYNNSTIDRLAQEINSSLGSIWFEDIKFILVSYMSMFTSPEGIDRIDTSYFIRTILKIEGKEVDNFLRFVKEYREAGLLQDVGSIENLKDIYNLNEKLAIHLSNNLTLEGVWKVRSISSFKVALKIARALGSINNFTNPILEIGRSSRIPRVSSAMRIRAVQLFTFLYDDEEVEPSKVVDVFSNLIIFLSKSTSDESLMASDTLFFTDLDKLIFKDLWHHILQRNGAADRIHAAQYLFKALVEHDSLDRKSNTEMQDVLTCAKITLTYRAIGIYADIKDIQILSNDNMLTSFLISVHDIDSYMKVIESIATKKSGLLKQLQLACMLASESKGLNGHTLLDALRYVANRDELNSRPVERTISTYEISALHENYMSTDRGNNEIQSTFFKTYLTSLKSLNHDTLPISDEALSQFVARANQGDIDLYKTNNLVEQFNCYSTFKDIVAFKSFAHFQLYYNLSEPSESIGFNIYHGSRDMGKRYARFLLSLDKKDSVEKETDLLFVNRLYNTLDKNSSFKKIYGAQNFNEEIATCHIKNIFMILDVIAVRDPNLYGSKMSEYLPSINTLLGYIAKYRTDGVAGSIVDWMVFNLKNRPDGTLDVRALLLEVLSQDNRTMATYLQDKFRSIDIPTDRENRNKSRHLRRYTAGSSSGYNNNQRSSEGSSARNRDSHTSFFTSLFKRFAK